MPTTIRWSCDYCGMEHDDKMEASACEAGHIDDLVDEFDRAVPRDYEIDGSLPLGHFHDLACYVLQKFDRKPFVPASEPPKKEGA